MGNCRSQRLAEKPTCAPPKTRLVRQASWWFDSATLYKYKRNKPRKFFWTPPVHVLLHAAPKSMFWRLYVNKSICKLCTAINFGLQSDGPRRPSRTWADDEIYIYNLQFRLKKVQYVNNKSQYVLSVHVCLLNFIATKQNTLFVTEPNLVTSQCNSACRSVVTESVRTSTSSMAKFIAWGSLLLPCLCALVSAQQLSSLLSPLFSSPH